jgi:hypothetical protein
MRVLYNNASLQAGFNIISRNRIFRGVLYGLCAALLISGAPLARAAAPEEGVALAIVYDTSGSMRDMVKATNGLATAKYVIANRALVAIANQVQAFATNTSAGPRRVDCGVFVFSQSSAKEAVPFGPFNRAAIQDFAAKFKNPEGSTPLGNALMVAGRAVLASPLKSKHVLVLTDGVNTSGPDPSVTLPRLKQEAKDLTISAHFVAFDVNAQVFDKIKKQGATVVSAMNELQLDTQLQFILQRRILLEDEEKK